MNAKRSAFTVIELMVVILIIAILAGILLSSLSAMGRTEKRRRSETVLRLVALALAVKGGERGGGYAGVEHPLAGSAVPTMGKRPLFTRPDGTAVAQSGEALVVRNPAWLSKDQNRVLLPDDIYSEAGLPLLYGIQRRRCRTLGASWSEVTTYRDLPSPDNILFDKDRDGKLDTPYDNTRYQDQTYLVSGNAASVQRNDIVVTDDAVAGLRATAPEWRSKTAIETLLGGDTLGELRKLRAVTLTSDPAVPTDLIMEQRVCLRPADEQNEDPARWQPGCVLAGPKNWKSYRLRGMGICDAWGNEILLSLSPEGRLRVESAGPDGVFRWHPGEDGIYQTAPLDTAPAGDDRDGSLDNLSTEGTTK